MKGPTEQGCSNRPLYLKRSIEQTLYKRLSIELSYTKGSQKQVLAKIRGNWGICGGLAVVHCAVVLLETGSNFQRPTCLCQAQILMLNDSDTM